MAPIPLLLMCFAFVCFALAASPVGAPRWNLLVAAGLGFWAFTLLLGYSGAIGR